MKSWYGTCCLILGAIFALLGCVCSPDSMLQYFCWFVSSLYIIGGLVLWQIADFVKKEEPKETITVYDKIMQMDEKELGDVLVRVYTKAWVDYRYNEDNESFFRSSFLSEPKEFLDYNWD